jgi:hypothetical protein
MFRAGFRIWVSIQKSFEPSDGRSNDYMVNSLALADVTRSPRPWSNSHFA